MSKTHTFTTKNGFVVRVPHANPKGNMGGRRKKGDKSRAKRFR